MSNLIKTIILISMIFSASLSYAEENKQDNKTVSQKEKIDKIVKDFMNNIEKTIDESIKKVVKLIDDIENDVKEE